MQVVGNVNHILGKYAPTAREFVLELDYGEVKINIFDQNLSQWHTASSGNSINLNEWVSIVATYNKIQTLVLNYILMVY